MTIVRQSEVLAWSEANINKAPETCGVYTLRTDTTNETIGYVGSAGAGRLRARLMEHWVKNDDPRTKYFHWAQCTDEENAWNVERDWIQRYKPPWNE